MWDGYSSSDDYYDHPHSTSQDGYHDEDERQRLQQSIDVIWPDDEWLSPEEELLHTAADFLITVKPWCSPGQRPERYIAALATLGTTLRRHPCAHAVPGKLSRLFEDSPYFELCSEGRTALLRLDVQAVLDAADGAAGGGGGAGNMQSCVDDGASYLRTSDPQEHQAVRIAIEALWPRNDWLSPQQQLCRSAAEYLLSSARYEDQHAGYHSPAWGYTAPLCRVGEHLASHPHRHEHTGKLSALFDGSPYFVCRKQGRCDLLSLDDQAMLAAAARLSVQAATAYVPPPTSSNELNMTVQLPSSVLGINRLHVRLRQLASVSDDDMQWLLSAERRGSGDLCLGFDTEFRGSQLALIQLGNAERVLLIRVPRSSMLQHVPYCLDTVLTSPYILKAAAEAWKDAQMVYQNLGVGLCGGVCLTAAFAPLFNNTPGLFTMMHYLFPSCGLNKNKRITTSDWFLSSLSQKQLRYAALDAFASWAVAAGRHDLVDQAPKIHV